MRLSTRKPLECLYKAIHPTSQRYVTPSAECGPVVNVGLGRGHLPRPRVDAARTPHVVCGHRAARRVASFMKPLMLSALVGAGLSASVMAASSPALADDGIPPTP